MFEGGRISIAQEEEEEKGVGENDRNVRARPSVVLISFLRWLAY